MIIGNSVCTWYQNEISLSAELIDSFVKGVEKQAAESIVKYEEGKETHVWEDDAGERAVQTHQGLDSESWDLATTFKEYFPSLQRRSAFLTVYGYFEHALDMLCALYKSEKGFGLALSDLHGKGIERSMNYLEKVAGLNGLKASPEWNRITKMRTLRNNIAHQDAQLRNLQGKTNTDVLDAMEGMRFLRRVDDEIVVEAGFLSSVVEAYKNYFKLISSSIEATEKH